MRTSLPGIQEVVIRSSSPSIECQHGHHPSAYASTGLPLTLAQPNGWPCANSDFSDTFLAAEYSQLRYDPADPPSPSTCGHRRCDPQHYVGGPVDLVMCCACSRLTTSPTSCPIEAVQQAHGRPCKARSRS